MKILTYIRSHMVLSSGIAIVAVVVAIIGGRVASRSNVSDTNLSNIKKVTLVDVENFRNSASKVSADGIVESVSQADLKSQISAPLSVVNVSIGDTVSVGQTIAVLQNADIRAQLDQAKAGLQLAQGQYSSTGTSIESSRKSTLENIRGSYITADEIINVQLNQFLYESNGGNQSLSSYITNRELSQSILDLYLTLKGSFKDWKKNIDSLSVTSDNAAFESVITQSQKNLKNISILLDDLSQGVNEAITNLPASTAFTSLSNWQSIIASARSSTNSAIKNLTSAESGLSGSVAQISSASAIVRNLEAQLAKTVITSPISGKIAALPLRVGELAQPGQLIATVVGGGGLQVKAYASSEDFASIKANAHALIQGTVEGTVLSVAPSVNQVNKKIELKISVNNSNQNNLVVGQNVSVMIDADKSAVSSQTNNYYVLPIQNVKIVPGDAYVFTVDNSLKIVRNPVILGKVQGDFVEIISGISSNMKIISPVYELQEGETVTVQQ